MAHATTIAAEGRIELPPSKTSRTRKPKYGTLAERFWANVDRSRGFFDCHPFTGAVMQANGYGAFTMTHPRTGVRSARTAHAVAWEIANGQTVPEGKIVLHAHGCCKACCNPAHLRIGTHAENAADRVAEGRAGRRLSKAEVLEIAHLHQTEGASAAALATRFKCDPSVTRRIIRGETHAKLTGIERNSAAGNRPKRERTPIALVNSEIMIASAVPAPAPAPVIILDNHRKGSRKAKPEATIN